MTVVVATFIASVYLAGFTADATGATGVLSVYASLADHFELLGYVIVALFAAIWLPAATVWRGRGLAQKYGVLSWAGADDASTPGSPALQPDRRLRQLFIRIW